MYAKFSCIIATQLGSGGLGIVACRHGEVLAWGINDYGQLGNGTTTYETSPTRVPGLEGIADIAAGGWHSLALSDSGGAAPINAACTPWIMHRLAFWHALRSLAASTTGHARCRCSPAANLG